MSSKRLEASDLLAMQQEINRLSSQKKSATWMVAIAAILAVGALAAAGYFCGIALQGGLSPFATLPFKISFPIAAGLTLIVVLAAGRRIYLSIKLRQDEKKISEEQLIESLSDPTNQFLLVHELSFERYLKLLDHADTNEALAAQLAYDHQRLTKALIEGRSDCIRACYEKAIGQTGIDQLVYDIQQSAFSNCPHDKKGNLKKNLDIVLQFAQSKKAINISVILGMIKELERSDAVTKT